jgi:hypothetical protein
MNLDGVKAGSCSSLCCFAKAINEHGEVCSYRSVIVVRIERFFGVRAYWHD